MNMPDNTPETPDLRQSSSETQPTGKTPDNVLFRVVIVLGGAFAFTAMVLFAATLGNPDAPINAIIDRYGLWALGILAALLIPTALLAMAIDRRQTLAHRRQNPGDTPPAG